MNDIHSSYEICEKIVRTTTENGSNFIKYFCVFGEYENNHATKKVNDDANQDNEDQDEVLEILWLKMMASRINFRRIIVVHVMC